MFCPGCGEKNPDGARFCRGCGEQLPASSPAAPAARAATLPLRRGRGRLVACVLGAVAVAGALALLVVHVFMGGPTSREVSMTNASIGYGCTATVAGFDYYWDPADRRLIRADPDDGQSAEVMRLDDEGEYVRRIDAGSDDVFVLVSRYDGSEPDELRRVSADGSDVTGIYRAEEDPSGGYGMIRQANEFDGMLFVAVEMRPNDATGSPARLEVWRMKPDGSERELLASVECDPDGLAMGPDSLYYTDGQQVFAYEYGDAAPRLLYASAWDYLSPPAPHRGRAYFMESYDKPIDGVTGYRVTGKLVGRITSVALDGSDVQSFDIPQDGEPLELIALADDVAYLQMRTAVSEDGADGVSYGVIAGFSLSDGSLVSSVELPPAFGNPRATDAGGHLVVAMMSNDSVGAAYGAYALGYDGTVLRTYEGLPADGEA